MRKTARMLHISGGLSSPSEPPCGHRIVPQNGGGKNEKKKKKYSPEQPRTGKLQCYEANERTYPLKGVGTFVCLIALKTEKCSPPASKRETDLKSFTLRKQEKRNS